MLPTLPAITLADIGYGWFTESRWWLLAATMLVAAAAVTAARKGR
jgi:hypothetical protein